MYKQNIYNYSDMDSSTSTFSTLPNYKPIDYYYQDIYDNFKYLSSRKQQMQQQLKLHRNKLRHKDENNLNNFNSDPILCKEIGHVSGFDKNTPLINYLINKRINFCELGSSSHIAAFISVVNNSRYCFIRGWCKKDCYG